MKTLSPRERFDLLSAYADGELDAATAREVEDYLASSDEARRELEQIRTMKQLVKTQPDLPVDPTFWMKLSERLRERREEEANLLPFPRRFAPAIAAFAVVLLLAAGLALYERRGAVEQFLTEKAEQVQNVYQNGVLKGTLLPLFSNISNDQVLQFAMYGALPLDAKAETALRIDESTPQGYKIELGKRNDPAHRPITVEKLMAEVNPTPPQRKAIDSLLNHARQRLSAAVFVAENNALAVDPELPRLNKMVLAQIAECLAPPQRVRFDEFLKKHEAAFAVQAHALANQPRYRRIPPPMKPEQFLVITPDTFAMTILPFEVEALRRQVVSEGHRMKEIQTRVQNLVRHFQEKEALRVRMVNAPAPSVRVWGDREFLEIEFHPSWVPRGFDTMGIVVRTRPHAPRPPRGVMIETNQEVGTERDRDFDSSGREFLLEKKISIERSASGESKLRIVLPEQPQSRARGRVVVTPKDSLND